MCDALKAKGGRGQVHLTHFAVEEGNRCDRAFGCVAVTCSDHDLVEEYLACGIWPLSHG
jgi:hypothetical protein